MAELSKPLKNFLTLFEQKALPHLNKNVALGEQSMVVYVSTATIDDPQVRELLGISPGSPGGKFMGVTVKSKPDMEVELFNKEK